MKSGSTRFLQLLQPPISLSPIGTSDLILRVSEVTRILDSIHQGDSKAAEELLPLVYDELRKLATVRMAREPETSPLQPTALVHESYEEAAQALGISERSTKRSWTFARAWLYRELSRTPA
jgi:hypothetical protein